MTNESELDDADIEALAKEVSENKCRSFVWAAQEFAEFILARRRLPGKEDIGIELRGWTCSRCLAFNGEEKEKHSFCRCCALPRVLRVVTGMLPPKGMGK